MQSLTPSGLWLLTHLLGFSFIIGVSAAFFLVASGPFFFTYFVVVASLFMVLLAVDSFDKLRELVLDERWNRI